MVLTIRRRIVNSTLVAVLLHLVVVGSGFACGLPTHDADMPGMPGMASMAGMQGSVNQGAPAAGQGKSPCRLPWAPDGCQSMATCVPAAVKVVPILFVEPAEQSDHAESAYAPMFSSLTRTPEPRPPRA